MTKFESGSSKPYYQIVREVLSANIASGNLPAGTRLLTSAVADRLGVSRPPVKRALELLGQDGIISSMQSQGYVVGSKPNAQTATRPNLHLIELDLPTELGKNLGQASWQRIFEAVEEDVMNCIPFGTFQISEAALGEYFEVSRTVIRDVLSRMDARGLIAKDRSSHWIAGPFGARMLNEAHEVRRLVEPIALAASLPLIDPVILAERRGHIREALAQSAAISQTKIDTLEDELHINCIEPVRNRRLAETVRLAQISLVINRLFGTYIGVHDETDLLREHALVFDHMLLGDADGTMAALRFHLDADHQRARARLKVLSVFNAPEIAPYLTRVH
jgi:DNA-binding GntR family transcriptional regulator